jgi:hypothetical protein
MDPRVGEPGCEWPDGAAITDPSKVVSVSISSGFVLVRRRTISSSTS